MQAVRRKEMCTMSEQQVSATPTIEERQIRIKEQELEIRRAQLAVEFAKYGFAGTLTGAIGGMILVLSLAIIDAYSSDFAFGANGVIWTSVCITLGVVVFGALSLYQPIRVLAELGKIKIGIDTRPEPIHTKAK